MQRKSANQCVVSSSLDGMTDKHSSDGYKCVACYKQFKRKEHLVEHMKVAYHSIHEPRCGVCQKHCKSFESVREHLNGPLAKGNCGKVFSERGCNLCLKVFVSANALRDHKEKCIFSPPGSILRTSQRSSLSASGSFNENRNCKAVAIDCEMVGGGDDGSLNLCARVCLIDEDENVILDTYVKPQAPVTDYRYEVTGLTEEVLREAMPYKDVQDKILEILFNGGSELGLNSRGGGVVLLVGHGLKHDLDCLRIKYPTQLLRDTANYRPLMKTNLVSHSLKRLTRLYLGYDIQSKTHDPYEDCVSAMRLYKKMRAEGHRVRGISADNITQGFMDHKSNDLQKMSPEELYKISKSDYKCWCLDRGPI